MTPHTMPATRAATRPASTAGPRAASGARCGSAAVRPRMLGSATRGCFSDSMRRGSSPHGPELTSDERACEIVRVERAEVLEPLTHADELDRQTELVGDRDG